MQATTALFYAFSAILVFASLRVITARNPVHSALFLVLAFCSASSIWMLLKAEFLAITLVLVYVGAVMVLFLFVVMMLDINIEKLRQGFWENLFVGAPVAALIVFEMSAVLWKSFRNVPESAAPQLPQNYDNTKALGQLLYTEYVYPFELAAVLLLLAMVAAIALTLRHRKDTRTNDPSKAVKTKAADRIRLVSVKPESDRASGAQQ